MDGCWELAEAAAPASNRPPLPGALAPADEGDGRLLERPLLSARPSVADVTAEEDEAEAEEEGMEEVGLVRAELGADELGLAAIELAAEPVALPLLPGSASSRELALAPLPLPGERSNKRT